MTTTAFTLDPSGTIAANLVSDELQVSTVPTDITQANFIIPNAAPFFSNTLKIHTQPNQQGTSLVEGQDYMCVLRYVSGSESYGKTLYGGIILLNNTYAGNVYLTYQTLGGDAVVNDTALFTDIVNKYYSDSRFTTWDQITGVPSSLPPSQHTHSTSNTDTFKDMVAAVERLAQALLTNTATVNADGTVSTDPALALIKAHIASTSNAHTPSAVGLGNVPNYGVATEDDANNGASDSLATPYIVSYMIRAYVNSLNLSTMTGNISNITTSIASINQTLQNLQATDTAFNTALAQTQTSVTNYQTNVTQLMTTLQSIKDTANQATSVSAAALANVSAAIATISALTTQLNNVVYLNTTVLPAGTHLIQLPAGQAMRFELVGAGGGSGRYYNTLADGVVNGGTGPSAGQSTVLRFLGSYKTPIEPVPLLVAGGGGAGCNTYGTIGSVGGGVGGRVTRYKGSRVNISAITNVNLSTDLQAGVVTEQGTTGSSGDTGSSGTQMPGVGGWTLGITSDTYHLNYGQGRPGTTKAGLGGSGAHGVIVINNDSGDTMRFSLQVGRGGTSARNATGEELTQITEDLSTDGVAAITLVS